MSNIVDFQDDNFLIKYLPTLKLRYLYYYNADFVMNILMEATKLIQQILKTFKLNMCCDCWKLWAKRRVITSFVKRSHNSILVVNMEPYSVKDP